MLEEGDGIDLVQCYDPRSGEWKELAPMLIARSGSAACVLNGYIYVLGKLQFDRHRPGVAVVDGKIYVCAGRRGKLSSEYF